jgi:hypothetical protein
MRQSLLGPLSFALPAIVLAAGCSGRVDGAAARAPKAMFLTKAAREARAKQQATGQVKATATDGNMTYRGGLVLASVNVVPVFWGSETRFQSDLTQFYSDITNSRYIDWMSEYNTPSQQIGRGQGQQGVVDGNVSSNGTISGDDVINELGNLIDSGAVPGPDDNTLYAVHFAPGISISDGSCQSYCAYHSNFTHNGSNVFYSVVPDQGGGCASGCGVDGDEEHATTDSASHELGEAITDPVPGAGWYNDDQGEIGDPCGSGSESVNGWVVQSLWSNANGGCINP